MLLNQIVITTLQTKCTENIGKNYMTPYLLDSAKCDIVKFEEKLKWFCKICDKCVKCVKCIKCVKCVKCVKYDN